MGNITLNAEFIISFESKNDWIRKCPSQLPKKQNRAEQWVWLDKNGNTLAIGEDFERAEIKGTYPVNVYRLIRVTHA